MKNFLFPFSIPAAFFAAAVTAGAEPVLFGHINVVQNGTGDTAGDITLSKGAGGSTGWDFRPSFRGSYSMTFGRPASATTGDVAKGVPITAISQHSTQNPVNNGAVTNYQGISFATSSIMAENTDAAPKNYRILTHRASSGASATTTRVNINSAFAYFPYDEWLAGRVANSSRGNGSANNSYVGSSKISLAGGANLGKFTDLTGGLSTLDLTNVGGNSATGILLVNHAKDEANFALSRANDDGTFTIINHDNGADASTYERDPVAFAFVPLSKVGTESLVATGRINGNASVDAGAGNFISTKGSGGEWLLKIPGFTDSTGVLVISPEGGEDTNVDNIIAYQWSEADQGWVIQSRDLNGGTASPPGLQNLAAEVGVYSFAFFSTTGAGNLPPEITVTSPVSGSTHPGGTPLVIGLDAADADGSVAKVEVYEGPIKVGEVTTAPFSSFTIPSPRLGKQRYTFTAIDDLGSTRTSTPFEVTVVPTAGSGSLFFDGTDDYVTFGDAPELKLRTFTLECWFRREGPGIEASTGSGGISGLPLISKGRGENDNRNYNCNYFLGVRDDGILVADFEDYNSGLNHPVVGKTAAKMGEWNHAAVTFDGTEWRLYLNGELQVISNTGGEVPEWVSIQHAALGAALDSTGTPSGAFCGYMDEVRIWDYARSGNEIAATMGEEILSGGGLVARYGFDQSSGTSLTGTSGPSGSLANGTFWAPAYTGLVPSSNQLPVVELNNAAGAHYLGSPLVLQASAADDGGIDHVEFYANGTKLGTADSAPYQFTWNDVKIGSYQVTARAFDNQGASASSVPVQINVLPQVGNDGLYFDGVDDFVTFGNNSALALKTFTLETWFRKETGGVAVTSGSGGVTVIPLISHGRGENDDNTFNCNYLFGIRGTDGVLAADFEEGPGGSAPGLNHPIAGVTPVVDGVWNHAAVSYDGTTWRLYLNGNLESELAVGQETAWNTIQHAALGSALDSAGAPQGFLHGMMDETRIWSYARSTSEIRSTMNSEVLTSQGLIARYGMSNTGNNVLPSSTGSNNGTLVSGVLHTTGAPLTGDVPPDIIPTSPLNSSTGQPLSVDLKALVTDPDSPNLTVKYFTRSSGKIHAGEDFTLIALPDTQYYSAEANGANATWFSAQTDWVISEMDARNIKFAMHLGDITDQGALDWQWANATNALYRFENRNTTLLTDGVPYSVAVGNHDQTPNGNPDGSTALFNTYFGVHPATGINHFVGKGYYGGTQIPDSADNNYTLFSGGGLDFIVVSLEYDTTPDPEDMAWADALLKAYPKRRAIIITHHMVNTGIPATFSAMGQGIYNALKNNPNLMLMYGGHIHGEGRRSDVFEGRTVHSLLADYQSEVGGNGWLRLMKFSPKNNRMDVSTYSPTLNQWKTGNNSEFSLEVDLQSQWNEFTELATVQVTAGTEATATLTNLDAGTKYEWYATVSDGKTTFMTPVQSFTTEDDNFAPQVELTRPFNGSFRTTPASVTLEAAASDDHAVTKVQFFKGTELIAEVSQAPYQYQWDNIPVGSYTLFAKAFDEEGLETLSQPVAFSVESSKPVVTVVASDALAGEFGDDKTLEFTLSRTGDVSQPLTVGYLLGGTSSAGSDYSGNESSVTFPFSESSVKVVLNVLADDLSEGNETVELSTSKTDLYDVANPSAATALISDKPSQAWAFANLAGNPKGEPGQDADGDGRANLLEYFMKTGPGNDSDRGVFEIENGEDGSLIEVTYQRARNLTDVTGGLEWSSDLKTWHGSGENNGATTVTITESVSSSTTDVDLVKAQVKVTAGAAPERIFVRITVQ